MASTITDNQTYPALRYVFVYGTLRRGEQRDINRLHPAPAFIGNAEVEGTLYSLGSYPGLRLQGGQRVQGEVYQISFELEPVLDEIEGICPVPNGEYVKRDISLLCNGLQLTCLIYEVSAERSHACSVIESGDWLLRT